MATSALLARPIPNTLGRRSPDSMNTNPPEVVQSSQSDDNSLDSTSCSFASGPEDVEAGEWAADMIAMADQNMDAKEQGLFGRNRSVSESSSSSSEILLSLIIGQAERWELFKQAKRLGLICIERNILNLHNFKGYETKRNGTNGMKGTKRNERNETNEMNRHETERTK